MRLSDHFFYSVLVLLLSYQFALAGDPSCFGACRSIGAQQSTEVVGTWVLTYDGKEYVWEFRPDGMFSFQGQQGTFSYSAGQLTTYLAGQTVQYSVRVSGNTMWLTSEGPNGSTMTLTRRSGGQGLGQLTSPQGAPAGTAGQQQSLIGSWVMQAGGQEYVVVFNADGTADFSGTPMTYQVSGNRIVVNMQGQTYTYDYSLAGNILTISGGDLEVQLQFTKRESAAGGQPGLFVQAEQGTATPKTGMTFDVYTFQADSRIKVGYPRGWTVSEHSLGVTIVEKQAADTAGIDVIIGQLQAGMQTKEAFADYLLNGLRQNYFPNLIMQNRVPHPQAPDILTMDLGYAANNIQYGARVWTAVYPQANFGIFVVFHAPLNRYGLFNPDQILLSCLQPMFSGAQSSMPRSGAVADSQDLEILNGVFTRTLIYGNTSAPYHEYYDRDTGEILYDEDGLILRPDGTYYLKAEFGDYTTVEQGRYSVQGNQVTVVFSDGSQITFTMEDNGRRLNWYSDGVLLTEFFLLGVL